MKLMAMALAAVSLAAGAVRADEVAAPAAATWTSNVTATSQYVSRGIRQTWGRPALQGGADLALANGWSAGFWASSIDERFVEKGKIELDVYGGYAGNRGDFGYSALLYVYRYPGAIVSATGTKYDYGELSAGLTWKALYAKLNYTYTRDFFGIADARGIVYADIGASHDLGAWYVLQLHAGDGHVAGAGNAIWNWRDVRAGVTKTFGDGWSGAVTVTAAQGRTDAYRYYSTGVPYRSGPPAVANAARTTLALSVTRAY